MLQYVKGKRLESRILTGMKDCIAASTSCVTVEAQNTESCVDSLSLEHGNKEYVSTPQYLKTLNEFANVFANDLPNRTSCNRRNVG